jgi:uncharacterized protein
MQNSENQNPSNVSVFQFNPTAQSLGENPLERLNTQAREFILFVYIWMTIGLLLTGITGFALAQMKDSLPFPLVGNTTVIYGAIAFQIVLSMSMGYLREKLPPWATTGLFLLYALVQGVTLCSIFIQCKMETILEVFFITSIVYLTMAGIGFFIKKDLSNFSTFLMMAGLGLSFVFLVSLITHAPEVHFYINAVMILFFSCMTAIRMQVIKNMAIEGIDGTEQDQKRAIDGAFVLYLGYMGIFLSFLRMFGIQR